MGGLVTIRDMRAADVPALALQPSQVGQFGLYEPVRDETHGAWLAAAGPAWTAEAAPSAGSGQAGRIVAIAGFAEMFVGPAGAPVQAQAWALLGRMGAAHFAVRRFIAARLAEAPYRRIEAMARAACPAEVRWLELLGFAREGRLAAWGPLSEDHFIYARAGGRA